MSSYQRRDEIPKGSLIALPSTKAGRIRLIGLLGLNILQFFFPGVAPKALAAVLEVLKVLP